VGEKKKRGKSNEANLKGDGGQKNKDSQKKKIGVTPRKKRRSDEKPKFASKKVQ